MYPSRFCLSWPFCQPQSLNGKSKWREHWVHNAFVFKNQKVLIDLARIKIEAQLQGGKKSKTMPLLSCFFWDMWGCFFRVDLAQANKIRPIQSHGSTLFSDESDMQNKTMKRRFVLCQQQLGSSILHRHVRLSKIFIDPWHLILHVTRHGCRCQSLDSHWSVTGASVENHSIGVMQWNVIWFIDIYNAMVCMYYFRLYVLNSVVLYHYLYLYFTSIYVCMCFYVEMLPWARSTLKDWRSSLKKLGWAPHTVAVCTHILSYMNICTTEDDSHGFWR